LIYDARTNVDARRLGDAVLVVALLGGACTRGVYRPPRRPDADLAKLTADGVVVDAVDGTDIRNGSRYALLPGAHTVAVHLADDAFGQHRFTTHAIAFDLTVEAGHRYVVRPYYLGDEWRPRVVDTAGDTPVAVGALAASPVYHPGHRPGTSLDLQLGFVFGGTEIASAQFSDGTSRSLKAGQGVNISLGMAVTPLWLGDAVGFGAALDFGVKGWSVDASNGGIELVRFPVIATARMLVPMGEQWFLLAAAGAHKELHVHLTSSGVAAGTDVMFTSPVGPLAELGLYFASTRHTGVALSLRYTRAHYFFQNTTLDASNLGVQSMIHYDF
jgi:hypothetical protein